MRSCRGAEPGQCQASGCQLLTMKVVCCQVLEKKEKAEILPHLVWAALLSETHVYLWDGASRERRGSPDLGDERALLFRKITPHVQKSATLPDMIVCRG